MGTDQLDRPEDYEAAACVMCGSTDGKVLFAKGPSRVVRCRQCRLCYAAVRPKESVMTAIYNQGYFQDRSQVSAEFVRGQRTLYDVMCERILRRLGQPTAGARLLDIGCGTGKLLAIAQRYGWTVQGIEPSDYASRWARDTYGFDVRTGVFRGGEFPAGAFDAVVLSDVVEHLYAPLPMLGEILRILRPGGVCVITTPNVKGLSTRLFGGRNYALDATTAGSGHVTFFSPQTLRAILRAAGFAEVRLWTGELYLKNFTDFLQRIRPSKRSAADVHKAARNMLRPSRAIVLFHSAVNRFLKITRLGDQITALAYKAPSARQERTRPSG